jgi:GWxTD domain-containing protein
VWTLDPHPVTFRMLSAPQRAFRSAPPHRAISSGNLDGGIFTKTTIVIVVLAGLAAVCAVQRGVAHAPELTDGDVELRTRPLPPDLRQEIAALRYGLTPDELADLLSDPRESRCRIWIDKYWADRDPICTTVENEAREEHERRVEIAQRAFRIPGWPGWDQRGEVFIRYGPPSAGKKFPPDVDPAYGYIPPKELWYYAQFQMYVYFEDSKTSGNFRYFLERVHLPPGERPRNDRRVLASEKLDLYMDFMTVESSYYRTQNLHNPTDMMQGDKFEKMLFHFHDVLQETPSAFSFDFKNVRVPVHSQALAFRGGDAIDRVDVDAEYSADMSQKFDTTATRKYTTTAVIWDTSWKEVRRLSQSTLVPTVHTTADTACTVVSQISFALPPDFYHVGITVQDETSRRFTSYRQELTCWDFEQPIAMSDVCLASRIGPVRENSAFNRGALEVVPHPSARYRTGAKVPLYFEVYNLSADSDGLRRYTVEYSISPQTPRPRGFFQSLVSHAEDPTTVVSRFNFTAYGPQDVVHVLVNTVNLWPGDYVLQVSAEDDVSSRRVDREVTFHLTEGR